MNLRIPVVLSIVLLILSACIEPTIPNDDPDEHDDSAGDLTDNDEIGEGLTGAYFDSTSGERLLVRTDGTVDFDWHYGSPDPVVPEDYFSAVWTGYVRAPEPAEYLFSVRVDDGFRLFIDDEPVAESWKNQGGPRGDEPLYDSISVSLGEEAVPIRLEYYEAHATAVIRLYWRAADESAMRIIDTEYLYPGDPAPSMPQGAVANPESISEPTDQSFAPGTGLRASYFDSRTGSVVLSRTEANLDLNWGTGSPLGVPQDHFSLILTGELYAPQSGTYTFHVTVDDGARLLIAEENVLPDTAWANQPATEYTGTAQFSEGERYPLRIEYYEAWGDARLRVEWTRPDGTREVIPTEYLYPGEASTDMPQGVAQPEESEPEPTQPEPSEPVFDGTYGPRDVPRSRAPTSGDTFVSPSGSGDCSESDPCSLIQGISRGGHIWMDPGVYRHSGQIRLGSEKTLESIDPNDKAIIDFEYSPESRLVITDSNELRNFVVRRSSQVGIVIWGNHNLIEGVITEHNRGSGIHFWPIGSAYSNLKEPDGASYNTIRDTIARFNDDRCAGTGASTCTLSHSDGISVSAGRGNLIEYSAAYANTDDGFDFWRSYMGTIRYSVAYGNGYNAQGNRAGHGLGFKMGSSEGPVPTRHLISSNWAYDNAGAPFSRNSGAQAVFENNVCGTERTPCGPSW